MKLLLAADLHIGRASSRVPDSIDKRTVRAASAWQRLVGLAIHEGVDVVCLAGDVADEDNRFWEAIGPLEEGIRRLSESGIATVAVSGNHDHDVLVRLANQFKPAEFRLLGRGGEWERMTVESQGVPLLHIDGWSFPRKHVDDDPLSSYQFESATDAPVLGLLHGDLFDPASHYAPLNKATLLSAPVDGWLLGHIHKPQLMTETPRRWILYPGSVQALDPGEQGAHGVWITQVEQCQLATPNRHAISSVHYCDIECELADVATREELESQLLRTIRELAEVEIAKADNDHLDYLGMRLTLVGRTRASALINETSRQIKDELDLAVGSTTVGVERISNRTTPDIDLRAHAHQTTAIGVLAQLILSIDEDPQSATVKSLISKSHEQCRLADDHKDFAKLPRRTRSDQEILTMLRNQGMALLGELLIQATPGDE